MYIGRFGKQGDLFLLLKSTVNPEMGTTIPLYFQRYPKSYVRSEHVMS